MSRPADVLTLKNWKLNTPLHKKEGSDKVEGDSREISAHDLATFSDDRCFFVTADGKGVVMRVHHGDPTTSGSHNPRCELREMTADGSSQLNWAGRSGKTHRLTVVGQVNRVTPKTRTVVLAQVHGKDDDVTVFRLVGDTLCITDGDDIAFKVPGDFPLGKRYTLEFAIDPKGRTSYRVNGEDVDFHLKNSDPANYFKAGNYLQSNKGSAPGESTKEYSEVVLYSVTTSHSDDD